MNVDFAKIDDVNGQLTVTIEEKDYSDAVTKKLKEVGKQRPEPGFRPGKTPMGIIKKKYGAAVKYDVVNELVGNTIFEYIRDNKLHVLGNPVPEKENEIDINGKDYTLKFKVGLAPELNLPLNKETHIPYYTIQVSDDMMKRQDEAMRRRLGTQEEGEEIDATAVVRGEITELDENGQPKAEGVFVENGILAPEHFVDEEQKALFMGKKKDEVVVFNPSKASGSNAVEMGSMLHLPKEEATSHDGDFAFKVTGIIALKPAEENQEFYDNVFGKDEVHNHEEYLEALKKLIAAQLTRDSDYRFTMDARKALTDAVGDVKLPDEILKEFLIKRQDSNLTEENAEEGYAAMRPGLIWELIREDAAEKLNVKVEQEDLLNLAKSVAAAQYAQYGIFNATEENVENLAKQILQDKQALNQLAGQAFDAKLFNAIREAVTIDNNDVPVEEFNKLFEVPAAAEAAE